MKLVLQDRTKWSWMSQLYMEVCPSECSLRSNFRPRSFTQSRPAEDLCASIDAVPGYQFQFDNALCEFSNDNGTKLYIAYDTFVYICANISLQHVSLFVAPAAKKSSKGLNLVLQLCGQALQWLSALKLLSSLVFAETTCRSQRELVFFG